MYVTRPLSFYKTNPAAANQPPPPGPGSGYLVIEDEEYQSNASCCFGLCKDLYLRELPFPQDRQLTVEYRYDRYERGSKYEVQGSGSKYVERKPFYFIPAIDLPLSSNRYYVVVGNGKHKGKVCACSRQADMETCCFCQRVKDVKPREFDANDEYQQVEIVRFIDCCGFQGRFYAESIAGDGFPRSYLRGGFPRACFGRKGWYIYGSRSRHVHELGEALGVDEKIRANRPADLDSFTGSRSPSVAVGKWYCPFLFVREEEMSWKDQVENKNIFYEMSLEQFWEEIYACEKHHQDGNAVKVHAGIKSERATLHLHGEEEASDVSVVEGVKWFRSLRGMGGVGLDAVIMKRMRWEVERVGWITGEGKIERTEEYREKKTSGWKKFRCYVFVERFALRREDGTLILTYDFRFANEVRSKWD